MNVPAAPASSAAESTPGSPAAFAQLAHELQLARAEASAARQQLGALINHLREGLLLIDGTQHVVLVNEQLCVLFGVPEPPSYWVGRPLTELIERVRKQMADVAAYDASVAHLLTQPQDDFHTHNQLPLRDGRVLERDTLSVRLESGPGWLLTYRDITARLAAEQERDRQRQFYETVLDELPVEVAVLDEHFRYVYANHQAEPDPEKRAWLLDGHTVLEFCERYGYPLSLAEHRRRMFAEAETSSQPVFWDDHTPRPDGDLVHQRQFKLLSGAGQPGRPYMLGAGLDVTARVRAEERSQRSEAAVREQQAFMEQVFDTTPSAIFVRDTAGRLLFSNFMMAELAAQLGRPGTMPAAGHPWHSATDAAVLATGQELVTEDTLALASGERRWYHTVRRLLERPDGSRQVLGVSTDITDLKAAQLAAEAAAQARENFLANMSHEIRTPMNGVLGIAGLLAKTSLTPQQQDYVRTIRSSGSHLLNLLNDVLDVAKINSGKLELERIPFELLDSVGQAVAPLALQAEEKGLAFRYERPPQAAAWVLSDPFRLNQVLINLLANAIKFTERGSVALQVSLVAELPALRIVRFEVHDTGIGIKPEALGRIFDSFAQAYADTTRRFGGTGLGLTISQALVTQLGGELAVASDYGRGSTFSFTLPLPVAAAPAPGQHPSTLADGLLRGTRMLIAEDNDVNRLVASLHLRHWGVEVAEAVDGLAALHCLEQSHYDVVLMDIQMPGLNGLEVTRQLRRLPDPQRATTPVLALTANAFRSDNEKYLAAGLNDYLAKPFAEQDLYAKLVGLLRQPAPPLPAGELLPPAPAPAATPAAASSTYDLGRVRQEAKGQEVFVARMVRAFLNSTPPKLRELQAAAAARDWPRVAEVAHFLKPNLQLLAVRAALGPVQALDELTAPVDEALGQSLVTQLMQAVEAAMRELAAETAAAPDADTA
ncbi:response regulator [Hymenobacter sp. RP-2-7]|uniref:histidine kinase n=1 Tax=Hymenobacter polaris TaxID=2682546 RepID=A0A7Y0AF21_9BACT|nr:ATP-binding protein [Hymenobacter polaris]NML66206.1 response regulator [Hymenobacter polaris]